jgi:hypothetical protein
VKLATYDWFKNRSADLNGKLAKAIKAMRF